jgi:hypothetical protein
MPKLANIKFKINENIENPNGPPFTIYGIGPCRHILNKNTSYIKYVESLVWYVCIRYIVHSQCSKPSSMAQVDDCLQIMLPNVELLTKSSFLFLLCGLLVVYAKPMQKLNL